MSKRGNEFVEFSAAGRSFVFGRHDVQSTNSKISLNVSAVLETDIKQLLSISKSKNIAHDAGTDEREIVRIVVEKQKKIFVPYNIRDLNVSYNKEVGDYYAGKLSEDVFYVGSNKLDYFSSKDKKFYATCVNISNNFPNQNCSAKLVLADGLSLYVRFDRKYISRFADIVACLDRLFLIHRKT